MIKRRPAIELETSLIIMELVSLERERPLNYEPLFIPPEPPAAPSSSMSGAHDIHFNTGGIGGASSDEWTVYHKMKEAYDVACKDLHTKAWHQRWVELRTELDYRVQIPKGPRVSIFQASTPTEWDKWSGK